MDKHPERVSKAIALMMKESIPQKQAIAKALAMERAGHLRDDGSYERVKHGPKDYL